MEDNMYEAYCKDQFKDLTKKVDELYAVTTNGLRDAVIRIEADLKEMKRNRNRWIIAIIGIVTPVLFGSLAWMIRQLWVHVVLG